MATRPPPDWFDGDDAQQLLRHLEWQPEGFSLLFLFADAQPAQWLADWLNAELRPAGLPLQQPACAARLAHDPDALVEALMAELSTLQAAPGGVWLPMLAQPQQPDWDAARRKLLARLNERRFLLERDLPRPLLLVLPANFRPITREIAPDIWHIRVLSQQWHAPALTAALDWCWEKLPAGFPMAFERLLMWQEPAEIASLLKEWHTHKDQQGSEPFAFTGWQAGMALLAAGRLAEVKEILEVVLPDFLELFYKNLSAEIAIHPDLHLPLKIFAAVSVYEKNPELWSFIQNEFFDRLEKYEIRDFQQEGSRAIFDVYTILSSAQILYVFQDFERMYILCKKIERVVSYLQEPAQTADKLFLQSWLNHSLGVAAFATGHDESAVQAYQLALTQWYEVIKMPNSSTDVLNGNIALAYLGLADAHMGLQDWPAAEQALANSVAIFRQLAAVPRAPRHAREDLAIALARQALLPPGDLAPLQEAERILLQLCAEFVEVPAYPRELSAVRELRRLVDAESHPG